MTRRTKTRSLLTDVAWIGPFLIAGLLLPTGAEGLTQDADTLTDRMVSADEVEASRWTQDGAVNVDRDGRALQVTASLQIGAFLGSAPPDHQYHALVHREGSAAGKALFVTDASDADIARILRELGARDEGGVPMSAWNLRWVPLVPQPDTRVQGTPIQVVVEWEGAERPYTLDELLDDPGGKGIDIRFGGNEEHDHHWDSGCILCLFSCPGGVVSNAAYTIRDHQRGVTTFDPGERLPPDGTEVTITFLLDGG
ncbi:MAG: hypothetical protein EA351_00225 [Gemmatimonadales bacterium]|nr:MAG: hypothetical protein EA351_00225 [Gemmatimonadales bacterium]